MENGQDKQIACSELGWYSNTLHAQGLAEPCGHLLPGGHFVSEIDPSGQNRPAGHMLQTAAPSAELNSPARHGLQSASEIDPFFELNFPALQGMQAADELLPFKGLYVPAVHGVQADWPGLSL